MVREVLLRPGEPYAPELARESERNLRRLPYLGSVELVPRLDDARGAVDIEVLVRDRWAWIVAPVPDLGGGTFGFDLVLADLNFLGRGQTLGFELSSSGEEADVVHLFFREPRIGGSQWAGEAFAGRQGEAGDRLRLAVERPLRTLSSRWGFDAALYDEAFERVLYRDGASVSDFYGRYRGLALGVTRSARRADRRRELRVAYELRRERFRQAPGWSGPLGVAKTRGTLTARATVERFRFVRETHLDRMGPVEDLKLGPRGWLLAGASAGVLGSDRGYPLLGAGFGWWGGGAGRGYAALDARVTTRVESGEFTQSEYGGSLRLYARHGARGLLAARLRGDFLHRREDPEQLQLDSTRGLRGYESHAFDGSRRILASVEVRRTVHAGAKLALGAVGFGDAGMIRRDGERWRESPVLFGAGAGLRIGVPWFYDAPVARLDLGYGFKRRSVELSGGVGQRF